MFKIISNKEYEDLYDKFDRLTDQNKELKKIYNEKVNNDNQIFRAIIKIIKKSKQTQNYGSVMNTLNKIETEIKKLLEGE